MFSVISLFSGCGGGDLGLTGDFNYLGRYYERLPFEIVWANDSDSFTVRVYRHNLGDAINHGDIRNSKFHRLGIKSSNVDVLIAGFPCQDFSLTGLRNGFKSERGRLYKEIRRALRFFSPKLFIAENVPGLEHPPSALATVKKGLEGCSKPRYQLSVHRINAADYGVPQMRKRLLLIGRRTDVLKDLKPPVITHSQDGEADQCWISAYDCIQDLWDPDGPENSAVPDQDKLTRATIILNRPKRRDRMLEPGKPSPTIRPEHHGHIEVHYNVLKNGLIRRLTVRECARIQSFPDTFTFPVSATQAYRQIGNAIPPVVMHCWGRSISDWLLDL